jgi:hypothetical protein
MFRRVLVSVFLVVGLVAMSLGFAGASTSPGTWAPKFCTALKQWQTTVVSESTKANGALGKLSGGNLAGIRDEFVTFLTKDVAATQSAIRNIKKAGAPSSTNGAKIQNKVIGSFQSASTAFADAKSSASALSTTDTSSFVADATTIQQKLSGATDAFDSNFTAVGKLDKNNELEKAIGDAKACKFLTG